jgi:hypothetical protein
MSGLKAATTAIDAGCVRIRLTCRDGLVAGVQVSSERPDLAMALRGKQADVAVALVPLVFAVCGKAQGKAAALALAAARGVELAPCLDAAVESEVMREHLWRLLLDLPPLLGLDAQRTLFVQANRAVAAGDRSVMAALLAEPVWDFLLAALDAHDEPRSSTGKPDALLPFMTPAQSIAAWPRLLSGMARQPQWHESPCETGAYARQSGIHSAATGANKATNPIAARWHARYAELRSWSTGASTVGAGGTVSAAPVAPAIGRALVETARGLLMHEITLAGNDVADYRIVAPTEWNFHPGGILVRWLLGQSTHDKSALERFVTRAFAALDPCVRWEIEWDHGSGSE